MFDLLFVVVDPVVVHTTGITTATRMLPVLAWQQLKEKLGYTEAILKKAILIFNSDQKS